MWSLGKPMIVIDTSVWVQGFRVSAALERSEVDRLLARDEVAMVGVVMAEVLQGARNPEEFEELRTWLMALPYLEETRQTWVRVGDLSYQLRQRGLAVGVLDLVIATLALEHGCAVYSLDEHFQRIPGLVLYQAGTV
jgi:predicted nucleic acid-binding protein